MELVISVCWCGDELIGCFCIERTIGSKSPNWYVPGLLKIGNVNRVNFVDDMFRKLVGIFWTGPSDCYPKDR